MPRDLVVKNIHNKIGFSLLRKGLVVHKSMPHKQSGVTLIELMIAVILFAIIAAMTAPYTSSWIDSGRVQNAGDILDQAYRQAEALALRNPNAVIGLNPAAGIRNVSGTLVVCAGDPTVTACTTGGANAVWQSTLPNGVTVQVSDFTPLTFIPLTVLRIDSFGHTLDADASGALSYLIERGTESDTNDLF